MIDSEYNRYWNTQRTRTLIKYPNNSNITISLQIWICTGSICWLRI